MFQHVKNIIKNNTVVLTKLYILFSLIYYLFRDVVRIKEEEASHTQFYAIAMGNLQIHETEALITGTMTF